MVASVRYLHRLLIVVLRAKHDYNTESGSCTGVLYGIVGAIERDDMRQSHNHFLPDRP